MRMDDMILVSIDDHMIEPPDMFKNHVPDKFKETWEFEGKKSQFNDLFGGYSVFVSNHNPHYGESLRFARSLGLGNLASVF